MKGCTYVHIYIIFAGMKTKLPPKPEPVGVRFTRDNHKLIVDFMMQKRTTFNKAVNQIIADYKLMVAIRCTAWPYLYP